MECASKRMEIAWIETDKLQPNPWNPNRMSRDRLAKLTREVKEKGMLAALLVRPLAEGRYQVVDGEHRLRVAKKLKLPAVPCVVFPCSEAEAKVKTLQMNGLRGENDPYLLSELLRELSENLDLQELSRSLPWSAQEVEQMLSLAANPEDDPASPALRRGLEAPPLELFTALLNEEQKKIVDRALALAARREKTRDTPAALAAVCRAYIEAEKSKRAPRKRR